MKRLSKSQKAIIDRHFEAKLSKKYNFRPINTMDDIRDGLLAGETSDKILNEAERNVSITSLLIANHDIIGLLTDAYKREVTREFKKLFNNLKIS